MTALTTALTAVNNYNPWPFSVKMQRICKPTTTQILMKQIPYWNALPLALTLFLALLVSACSVHKIDVQQGNVITQEMFKKLKVGMDKSRVERVLGTALVVDPFHRNRWDYIYVYEAGNTDDRQSAHLSLYFENEQLGKIIVHSPLPSEAEVKKPGMALRKGSSSQGQSNGHSH